MPRKRHIKATGRATPVLPACYILPAFVYIAGIKAAGRPA